SNTLPAQGLTCLTASTRLTATRQGVCASCTANTDITWLPDAHFQPPSSYTVSFKVSDASSCGARQELFAHIGDLQFMFTFGGAGCAGAYSYQRCFLDVRGCQVNLLGAYSAHSVDTVAIAISGGTVTFSIGGKRVESYPESTTALLHSLQFGVQASPGESSR